jgi:hypothetical protein
VTPSTINCVVVVEFHGTHDWAMGNHKFILF